MQHKIRKTCLLVVVGFCALWICSCSGSSGSSSRDKTTTTASESVQLTLRAGGAGGDANLVRTLVTPMDYCNQAGNGSETQKCHSTPQNYDLGILAVYLVDCHDSAGNSVSCGSADYDNVNSRLELYNGDQRDLTIDANGTSFDQELTTLAADGTYGALQIVTAYVQQKFPDDADDPVEAAKVIEALKGITYRICTSPDEEIDGATMASRCGWEDAEMGDYLVDMDSDGNFGFMVVANDGITTTITESTTRPLGYAYNDPVFAAQQVSFLQNGEEYTSASFYGVAGYFAPMFPFGATQSMDADNDYQIDVSFTITDSFEWHDGADSGVPDATICVDAISDQVCAPDKDPLTVGVYDPFYDDSFLPNVPQVTVSLDELHERLYIATGEYSIFESWDAILRFENAEDLNSETDGQLTPDAILPVKQMVSADGIIQNFAHGVYLSDDNDMLFLSMLFTDEDYNGMDTECEGVPGEETTEECDTANRDGSIAIISGIKDLTSGGVTLTRHIAGSDTQINQPHGIWVDESNETIYVANTFGENILAFHNAFDSATDGNIAPDRVITSSEMGRPVFVYIDEETDRMFVASMGDPGASILIFNNVSDLDGEVTPETRIIDNTPNDRSDTDTTRLTMGNNQTTHNVFYDAVHEVILVGHHTNEVIFYDVSDWDLDTGMGDIEPDAADVKYLQINETSSDTGNWSAYGLFYMPNKDRLYVSCGYSESATEEHGGGPSPFGSPEHQVKVYDNVSDSSFSGMETPARTIHWDSGTTYYPPQGLWITEYE